MLDKIITICNKFLTLTLAQLAGAVEYTDCFSAEEYPPPNKCPGYNTKKIWWWGSSNAPALWNVEYPVIAIAPSSTLARSGSTW